MTSINGKPKSGPKPGSRLWTVRLVMKCKRDEAVVFRIQPNRDRAKSPTHYMVLLTADETHLNTEQGDRCTSMTRHHSHVAARRAIQKYARWIGTARPDLKMQIAE